MQAITNGSTQSSIPACMSVTLARELCYSNVGLQFIELAAMSLSPLDINVDGSLLLELLKMATRAADLTEVQVNQQIYVSHIMLSLILYAFLVHNMVIDERTTDVVQPFAYTLHTRKYLITLDVHYVLIVIIHTMYI
jgi:hypothetical protein